MQQLGVECHVLLLHNWYPPFGLHIRHAYWREGRALAQTFFEEYEGVKIHAIPVMVRMPARLFKDDHYQRAALAIAKYVKGRKELRDADWIYAHFLTDNGYISALTRHMLHIKVAAIARGDDVHAWPEQFPSLVGNLQYVYKHADLMLANNKRLAADALHWAGETKPKFRIAYNGINYAAFAPQPMTDEQVAAIRQRYNLPAGKKVLLCIGRQEYPKGWNELLQAIAAQRALLHNWVLLAVTDNFTGRHAMDVVAAVEQADLSDMVRVQRFVPHSEVKELYRVADAFILPSYNEGISNAVMEAMASGLWVIATDVGGHAEIMENNVSGFLIQPRSQQAVEDSLQYLVQHYDARKKEISAAAIEAMQRLGGYVHNARILLGYLQEK